MNGQKETQLRSRLDSLVRIAANALILVLCLSGLVLAQSADDGKLRIIVFGAHPDDCEFDAGGTAAMWAAQGHHVKFVSTTNGDIGHATMAGGPLAKDAPQRLRNRQRC